MIILPRRPAWQYSEHAPAFFTGQAGCFCCPGGGVYVFGGINTSNVRTGATGKFDGSSWTGKTSYTPIRHYHGGCDTGSVCYSAGGNGTGGSLSDMDSYTDDTWVAKTDIPTPARQSYDGLAATGGKAYLIYGFSTAVVADCDQYDPSGDSWTNKTDGPVARQNGSTSSLGSSVVMFGGSSATGLGETALADVDEYATGSDTWTGRTDMTANVRMRSAASEISSKAYVAQGGGALSVPFYSDTDEYVIDTWTAKTSSSIEYQERASSVLSGAMYCLGGAKMSPGYTRVTDVDEYTPDTWTSKTGGANGTGSGAGTI